MCGIVAYKGRQKCLPFLLDGLKRLEYRGYDSAGVAYVIGNQIFVQKQAGSVADLIDNRIDFDIEAYTGIGHTRWATHGKPCSRNAHPHITEDNRLAIVHNGIIENYLALKIELVNKGYNLKSDTDTEVLLYLIYDYLLKETADLFEAVKLALERVVGAYAIVVIDQKLENRHKLVIARKGSPLVVGLGENNQDFYVASDPGAFVSYANNVIYINDNTIGLIDQKLTLYNMENHQVSSCNIERLEHQLCDIEKGDFSSFMLKEIYEQPKCLKDCWSGRIDGYLVKLGGLFGHERVFENAKHITIVSCGSSWHAGLIAKYYIEEFCKIKVSVEYASEYRYRKPCIEPGDIVIGISQSGETADTISAIELAKKGGAFIVGICNVVNSSLSRLTDCGIYLRAGTEIGVASTKAFTNQILVLLMLALWIEQNQKGYTISEYRKAIIDGIKNLDSTIKETLLLDDSIKELVKKFIKTKNCLYLGRGYSFPIALEGALKLKELSYIHAEGYAAGEMKHGPLALVDKHMLVVALINYKIQYEKILNNIKEIQARSGKVITISNDEKILGDFNIKVPAVLDILSVFVSSVVMQLWAYHFAVLKDCNVDKPRNLAKSVTVE